MSDMLVVASATDADEAILALLQPTEPEPENVPLVRAVEMVFAAQVIEYEPINVGSRNIAITHEIAGESFLLEYEDDRIILSHSAWSLMGSGATLLEAEMDLVAQAREIAPYYLSEPLSSLDYEAYRMQGFLLDVI